MQRFGVIMSYNGKNYHGWQRQDNAKTIQEDIEKNLSKLHSNEQIEIVGCGRTDTGVHAGAYLFHFDSPQNTISCEELKHKLNIMLSADLVIHKVISVNSNFHARYDATLRTYNYYISLIKDPFLKDFTWFYPHDFDLEKMKTACSFLIGKQDFSSFSKAHTDVKTNICNVVAADFFFDQERSLLKFEITADRFLRNMVRAIVGTLADVGSRKIEPGDIKNIMESKSRAEAGESVPAQGLFLTEVQYPDFSTKDYVPRLNLSI